MPGPLLAVAALVTLLIGALAVRLLGMAARTRRLPELLMGTFFAGAFVGYAPILYLLSRPELRAETTGLAEALRTLYYFGLALPPITIAVFSWRVFRPQSRVAACVAATLSLTLLAVTAALARRGSVLAELDALAWIHIALRLAAFAWACAEATIYYVGSRRRLALGLADPMVTNRFLLWAIWSAAPVGMIAASTTVRVLAGAGDPTGALALVGRGLPILFGAACGGAVWLTFYPPRFYRNLIASRAA